MRNRMNMGIPLIGRLALLGTVLLAMAAVHGAALTSTEKAVEAGKALPLEGTGFHAGQTVRLVLLGTLTEYTLREVTVDDAGVFAFDVEVPVDVRPGQYQLLALSGVDTREAQMDLSVMAVSQVAVAADSHDDDGDDGDDGCRRACRRDDHRKSHHRCRMGCDRPADRARRGCGCDAAPGDSQSRGIGRLFVVGRGLHEEPHEEG